MNAHINPEDTLACILNPAAMVDELGLLKAQIAKLEAREKEITDALKAVNSDSFSGQFFDATVSRSKRETLDTKRLYEDLGKDTFKDYVRSTEIVTLKLTAKK